MTDTVWGRQPVLEMLKGHPERVEKLHVASGAKGRSLGDLMALMQQHKIPMEFADRSTLAALAGSPHHQGVVASLKGGRALVDVFDIVTQAQARKEMLLLVLLDQIQDPQNLGAILRSALGAGAHAVVTLKDRAAGLTDAVAKASAGASAHMPLCVVTNLSQTMDQLKQKGVWCVGADASPSAKPYTKMDWKRPVALVIGQEGQGLRRLVREQCDDLVKIPMKGPVGSLNASVAAGILLFEVVRTRSS